MQARAATRPQLTVDLTVDKDLQSVQEARDLVERAHQAFLKFRTFSQAQVDAVVDAMAAVASANAEKLARMAVEETTYGKVADKIQKNLFASQRVHGAIRSMKTVGLVREDPATGVLELATPVGVVAAILPTTNPTSTAIYKILIALKAGNSIVVSPHPAAMRCICETVSLMAQAAREAGAPEDVICCFSLPTMAGTQELMRHRRTAVVLATGGMAMVRAAYSSGKPAFGVGPGNVPALIDTSANLAKAVADVVYGKSFDWGTICSSEQAIVAEASLKAQILQLLAAEGTYFPTPEEAAVLGRTLIHPETFTVNPKCVGQSPQRLGELAGFAVPATARILAVELQGIGRDVPLSAEKLSPVLGLYFVPDRETAFQTCAGLLQFGGLGHTCVIHAQDDAVIRAYGARMPAYRVVVNSPAPQGSIGATTDLFPAMTLGCGAAGGNITSDNIGPQHLINLKRVAYERRPVSTAPPPPQAPPVSACGCSASAGAAGGSCGCAHGTPSVAGVSTPAPSAPPADRAVIRSIVDRFLAEKGLRPAASAVPGITPTASNPAIADNEQAAAPTVPKVAPPMPVLDFVSEADVRQALRYGRKLRIGPRTLLTPSARDLGYEQAVFEEVQGEVQAKKAAGDEG